MAGTLIETITPGSQYGPLQGALHFDLMDGYSVLVGPNNAGKSALLQLIFRSLINNVGYGAPRTAILLPDRDHVEPTTQTGARTLSVWNEGLMEFIRTAPLQYGGSAAGPPRSELPRLLMHGDFISQVTAITSLLPRLGLQEFKISGPQEIRFENVAVLFQGSGVRSLLPIVAALTNNDVGAVLIDEPELSLEPKLQKALRDVLIEISSEKLIVVATHSHLFLNRRLVGSNYRVTRENEATIIEQLATPRELYDATFELLGNSTEDLFFPRNYLIVEGASDQAIVEKALALLGTPSPTVKVLSAQGVDAVGDAVTSVVRAVVPLIVNDSPYAGRVVALIDAPRQPESESVKKLKHDLTDRLFILNRPTIEEYMPEELYARAGRSKDADVQELYRLKDDYKAASEFKRVVSTSLANVLTEEDLFEISTITDAARKAAS